MSGRLNGKAAVVMGAGCSGPGLGNGEATAILFAREGARVLCVDRIGRRAERTCRRIQAEGGAAWAAAADVSRARDVRRVIAAARTRLGSLDILHNNVGIASRSGILDLSEAEWDRVFEVNLKSMMLTSRGAIAAMIEGGGGSIINISSISGLRGGGSPAYSASKAGVLGLTSALAVECGRHRIRVNAISPGRVHTPMVASPGGPAETAQGRRRRRRSAPIPEEGCAWDVAWAAVYLASDESRWVTGQVVVVDGGLTATTQ